MTIERNLNSGVAGAAKGGGVGTAAAIMAFLGSNEKDRSGKGGVTAAQWENMLTMEKHKSGIRKDELSHKYGLDTEMLGTLASYKGDGQQIGDLAAGQNRVRFSNKPARQKRDPAEGPPSASTVAQGQQFNMTTKEPKWNTPEIKTWRQERATVNSQRVAAGMLPLKSAGVGKAPTTAGIPAIKPAKAAKASKPPKA